MENIKHVSTVNSFMRCLRVNTEYPETARRIFSETIRNRYPAGWWDEYEARTKDVENILNQHYYSYVVPQILEPSEIDAATEKKQSDIISELTKINAGFLSQNYTALKKLWELEAVKFNPVYNYDRTSTITAVRSGTESNVRAYDGSQTSDHTEDKYTDVFTDEVGARKTIDTDKFGKYTDTTNGTNNVEHKNNQSKISKHHDTSYNTNLINTDEVQYSGNADEDNTKIQSTSNYGERSNVSESNTDTATDKTTNDISARHYSDTLTYNNRTDTDTKEYHNVTDVTTEKTEGNIGVTTATAMMTEFLEFYVNYSFWNKFWELWIAYAASPTFDRDMESYSEWLLE